MKRLAVLGFVLWAATAQAVINWTVTRSQDCTAASTPTGCCWVAAPAVNPACLLRQNYGTQIVVRADLASDGGAYNLAASGDTLTSAALGRLGLNFINYADCWISNGGEVITYGDVTGKLMRFRIWTTAGTEQTAVAIPTTVYMTCNFYGR